MHSRLDLSGLIADDTDLVELSSNELTILCVVMGAFSLLGIASALQAIMTTRTSQGPLHGSSRC